MVVAFFICWAPFHLQRLLTVFLPKSVYQNPHMSFFMGLLYHCSGVFYFFSSVINPILYNIMSLKFRRAFKNTITLSCTRRRPKRTSSMIAYRFCRGAVDGDTDIVLSRLKHNDTKNLRGVENNNAAAAFGNQRASTSRSSDSRSAGSSGRHTSTPIYHHDFASLCHSDSKIVEGFSSQNAFMSAPSRPYHSYN